MINVFLWDWVNTVKLLCQYLKKEYNNTVSSYTCKLMYICLYLHSYFVDEFCMLKI